MKGTLAGHSSVARALMVLEDVGLAGQRSLAELAERTNLPKSTLLRLIASLIDLGFLQRTRHGMYAVSLKMWRIGCGAVDLECIRDAVLPALRTIVERTGETALYAVYEDGHAVYVEKVEGSHPIRAYAAVGDRSPAYASATGKALLSFRPAEEIEAVAARAEPLTPATLRGAAILSECAAIRAAGVSVNHGEWHEGVWGVAAPIFGRTRDVIAAVGVSGPRDRIEANVEPWAREIRAVARELSLRFGAVERAS